MECVRPQKNPQLEEIIKYKINKKSKLGFNKLIWTSNFNNLIRVVFCFLLMYFTTVIAVIIGC